MTSQIIPVDPFDFIIFGGTGDLAERKLLPALYYRQCDHQFSEPTRIIGASRSKMTDKEFQAFAEKAIREHVKQDDIQPAELKKFIARLSYVAVDAISGEGFEKLKKVIGESEAIRAFYLAVAPNLFGEISHKLKAHKLVSKNSRIVVEKPHRPRPGIGKGAQRSDRRGLQGKPDFPHRSLSRQGNGAEFDGAAFRQRALRAAVELRAYRPRADHRRRDSRAGRSRHLLRYGRRAARHGAEPHPAASVPRRHGSAVVDGRQCRARRKAESAALAEAHQRCGSAEADGARPVQGGRVGRRAGEGLCRRAGIRRATPRPSWR